MKKMFVFVAVLFLVSCVKYIEPEDVTLEDFPDLVPTLVPTEVPKGAPNDAPTEEPDDRLSCGYTESFGDYVLVLERRRTNEKDKVLYVLEVYNEVPDYAGNSGFLVWGEIVFCESLNDQMALFGRFNFLADSRMQGCMDGSERRFTTTDTANGKKFLVPFGCVLFFPRVNPADLVPEVQA